MRINIKCKSSWIDYKVLLIVIFFCSTFFRFFLSKKTGVINIVYDELLYWEMSESIWCYGMTMMRGIVSSNKEILYPLLISWAHCLGDFENVYILILFINALLMSSAIFPTYLLAKKILTYDNWGFFVALSSCFLPELFYSTRLLQENLYFPLVMWGFYLFYAWILEDKLNYVRVAIFSLYICLMAHVKMIGLCLLASLIFFYVVQFFKLKEINKKIKSIILVFESIIVYYVGKYLADKLISTLFSQTSGDSATDLTTGAFRNLIDLDKLMGYVSPVISYVVFIILFFGIFTIIIPLAYANKLPERIQDLLIFCIGLGIATVAVICLLVLSADNQLGQQAIRIHLRYIFYLFLPFLIVFIKCFPIIKEYEKNRWFFIISAIYILLVVIVFPVITVGSEIDCVQANSLDAFFMTEQRQLLLKAVIIGGVVFGNILLYLKKPKVLYILTFVMLMVLSVHSSQKAYKISYTRKVALETMKHDGEILNNYFEANSVDSMDSILLVGLNKATTGVLEVYLNIPYRVSQFEDMEMVLNENREVESFSNMRFYMMDSYKLDSYDYPEYIIAQGMIDICGYEMQDIGMTNFVFYKYMN